MSTRIIPRRRTANPITSAAANIVVERLESRKLLYAIPVDPEFHVSADDGAHFESSIAVDADGDFVIAWTSYSEDSDYGEIYAQRYNAAGVEQGTEFRVNTYTADEQFEASVAMDADGDFAITWTSYFQDGWYGGVYAQRYNAGGVKQGSEFRVNTYTTELQCEPSMAMDADGDFVIAWTSYYQDGDYTGIYAQRYNAAGIKRGAEFLVNSYTAYHQDYAAVAMDGDGDFVISWTSYYQHNDERGVYAQRYNAAGAKQGAEFQAFTTGDETYESAVAMDADGDFVIAWASYTYDQVDPAYDIYAQRYNAAGVKQRTEIRVTNTFDDQYEPSVAMDSAGDFVIAWESFYQDGDYGGIYAHRYNASGVPQEDEFLVNSYTNDSQRHASAAMDADGDFLVAWQSYGQDNDGWGVYAQRYGIVPEVTASSFLFESAPQRLLFTFSREVDVSVSSDDLVVQNLTTGQTIPSGQFSLSYDLATNAATISYTAGLLPDGNYRVMLLNVGVTTPAGAPLAEDYFYDFFVLAGDANRDRQVDITDLGTLATNWQQTPRLFSQGDFDLSGFVDITDLGILATNWQIGLNSPFGLVAKRTVTRAGGTPSRLIDQLADMAHIGLVTVMPAQAR